MRIAITANGAAARSEFGKTASAAETMGARFTDVSKTATGMGKTFERIAKVGAAMFVAERVGEYAGEFVKTAANFQSAMNLLVTAGGEAQSAIKGVSDGILKISGQTGTSADDLAEGMYTIEKAGYRAADGLNVLKIASEGARAENVDMATMTNAVTSIMTSYHAKASDATNITNELVAASGAAKTTMQLYAGSLASVLPSASAAGISFAEVGGAIATLTQHGTSADEATQELANTIRNLAAPNQVASKEMQQLGINVTDLSKNLGKRGLTGTLDLVVNAIGKNMGKSGLVMLDAFRKSKSASQDLQAMLKSMPPSLAKVSQGFLDGSVGMKDYKDTVNGLGGSQAAMGTQFLSLVKSTQGFNQLLTSGSPAAQTFTDALKRMLGGATGMNTALQLSGENMAGFKTRVGEISEAAKRGGSDISTWAKTQKTFSVELDRTKDSLEALGIKALLPLLPKMADGFAKVADELNQSHPTLEAAGHLIGDVAHAVDSLPGPLKSAALQAALFYPIIGKLQISMVGFGTSMRNSLGRNGLVGWTSALRDTETRSTAAGLAVLKMGEVARAAAGPLGMVALTQGIGKADTAVGGLETTLGAAAVGFSVGGPWGAAVGGAGGLIYSLAKRVEGATSDMSALQVQTAEGIKVKVDKSSVDSLITSLEKAHGDYKLLDQDAKTQALGGKVTAGQQAAVTTRTGLSAKTQADAYAGDPGAIKAAQKALDGLTASLDSFKAAQDQAASISSWSTWSTDMSTVGAQATQDFAAWGDAVQAAFTAGSINAKTYAADMKTVSAAQADGTETAQERNQAIAAANDLYAAGGKASKSYSDAAKALKTELGTGAQVQDGYNASVRDLASSLGITVAQLHKLPAKVQSKVELDGAPQTANQARQLLGDLGKFLEFKQLRSVVSLDGVALSSRQLASYLAQVRATPQQVVTAYKANGVALTSSEVAALQKQFDLTPKEVSVLLRAKGFDAAKSSVQGLVAAASRAAGQSAGLGSSAGSSFGSGYTSGIAKWTGPAQYAAAAMANAAHAAAMHAQDSHSPSRKAAKLGRWFSEGYAIGIADPSIVAQATKGGGDLAKAAAKGADKEGKKHAQSKNGAIISDLLNSLLTGVKGGSIDGALSKISGLVDRKITGKHQTKRQNKILDALKPQENTVKALAKQYDAILSGTNATGDGPSALAGFSKKLKAEMLAVSKITGDQINNLKDAQQALQDYEKAASDYAASIKDAVVATGDITTLGINQQTGGVSLSVLLSDMQSKVAAAEKFKIDMEKLTKAGLNQTDLQQLYAAGPDSLATADAILSGGAAAIKQINGLSAQLTATGAGLGAEASKTFYSAGINAAQGLVDGLKSKEDAVAALGKKMAKSLVDEVKKELKIKSPSRVFKEIGTFSVQGLDSGFNTTAIKHIGSSSATTLIKGFGRPALSAYMSTSATSAAAASRPQAMHLTADQLSDLLMGQKVRAWMAAADGVGVRQSA
ncbi:phage tail tape measure protein [Nocardioides sp. BP30]|uniref:phage tail tape measure protein n=1 Tax=Nocardioides sp. BP30 TaxID=3036374 RepID=UPI002469AEBA|nr:phage tail tape measure protein [Nocardioides sp. BP30]WGL50638.1 phage tail tape measure protein [Nocardioides sp. BP30]